MPNDGKKFDEAVRNVLTERDEQLHGLALDYEEPEEELVLRAIKLGLDLLDGVPRKSSVYFTESDQLDPYGATIRAINEALEWGLQFITGMSSKEYAILELIKETND